MPHDVNASVRVRVIESAPPTPTRAPVLSGMTSSSIAVNWDTVANATSYTLQRSLDGLTGWLTVYNRGVLPSHTDTELNPATRYHYRYSATNAAGTSGFSPISFADTTAVISPPATPTAAPTASGTDADSTTVTMLAITGATSYLLQRSTSATTGFVTISTDDTLTRLVTGLSAGTTYYFRYAAQNSAGTSGFSPNLTVTTSSVTNSVRPVSALRIRSRVGVASHPNHNSSSSVYKSTNANEICLRVRDMGMTHIRGGFPAKAVSDVWADACRNNGLKWLMVVVPEAGTQPTNQSVSDTTREVSRIRTDYAAICAGIEGINEPNHNRGGGTVPADWATSTTYGAIAHQKAIWDAARDPVNGLPNPLANVPILGSSLHDIAAQNSYTDTTNPSGGPRHYHQLAEGRDANGVLSGRGGLLNSDGTLRYCNMFGLHSYPGGSFPLRKLDERLTYVYGAFGSSVTIWVTEHGWHNALNTTAGHVPITEAGAGTYGPRAILQYVTTAKKVAGGTDLTRRLFYSYYEMLDDSQSLTEHEDRFGMYGVSDTDPTSPTTWRAKPIVGKVTSLLTSLVDPAGTAAYTPSAVTLSIECTATNHNLWYQVTATKAQSDAGTATLWIWRDMEIWNRETETAIVVAKVAVSVTDRVGKRDIPDGGVNAEVTRFDLR